MKLPHPISIEEISRLTACVSVVQHHQHITGINEIHKVETGDLMFTDHPKYYKRALQSAASVIILNQQENIDNPHNKTILYHPDPFTPYNFLTQYFSPKQYIYQQTNFKTNANIGANTIIQQGAVIGDGVNIGNNCIIYPNVVIHNNVSIGNNVIIHAGTIVGSDAFYYKKRTTAYEKMHTCGQVIIENDVEIGANCTIDSGVSGNTVIGQGTKIDNLVHLAHGVEIGKNCLIAAQVGIAGKTIIEDDVILWGQVGVSKSLTIGKGAIIQAQSGVGKTIEGGKVYFGSPVKESRKAMRQMAILNQLEKMWDKLKKL